MLKYHNILLCVNNKNQYIVFITGWHGYDCKEKQEGKMRGFCLKKIFFRFSDFFWYEFCLNVSAEKKSIFQFDFSEHRYKLIPIRFPLL